MDKTYIIRKYAYQYNDVYNGFDGEGIIEYVSTNYEEAYATWQAKELAALRTAELNHTEPLAITDPAALAQSKQELDTYMQQNFGRTLFRFLNSDNTPEWFWTEMPTDATDEQLWEIRRITGIRYYSLITFDETSSYYTVEIKPPIRTYEAATWPDQYKGLITCNRETMFFNTAEEAMNRLGHYIMDFTLQGSLEELSHMPNVLRQLIDSDEILRYNDATKQLSIVIPWGRNHSAGKILSQFFEILKEPLIILHQMSLEEARKIRFFTYE